MPKQTKQQEFLHEQIKKMRQEFEFRMLNIVAQVRALAIAANVSPNDFLEAFWSDQKQQEFFMEQSKLEQIKIGEMQLKRKAAEEQAEKEKANLDPNLAKFAEGQEEFMKEAIDTPGDKII